MFFFKHHPTHPPPPSPGAGRNSPSVQINQKKSFKRYSVLLTYVKAFKYSTFIDTWLSSGIHIKIIFHVFLLTSQFVYLKKNPKNCLCLKWKKILHNSFDHKTPILKKQGKIILLTVTIPFSEIFPDAFTVS